MKSFTHRVEHYFELKVELKKDQKGVVKLILTLRIKHDIFQRSFQFEDFPRKWQNRFENVEEIYHAFRSKQHVMLHEKAKIFLIREIQERKEIEKSQEKNKTQEDEENYEILHLNFQNCLKKEQYDYPHPGQWFKKIKKLEKRFQNQPKGQPEQYRILGDQGQLTPFGKKESDGTFFAKFIPNGNKNYQLLIEMKNKLPKNVVKHFLSKQSSFSKEWFSLQNNKKEGKAFLIQRDQYKIFSRYENGLKRDVELVYNKEDKVVQKRRYYEGRRDMLLY